MDEDILDNLDDFSIEEENQDITPAVQEDEFRLKGLAGFFEDWFLDYASYVILERAVPDLRDGFKPVQRRIMQSMKEMDDGRFNKVANIIGNTMKYHPHGDASIGDALVQLGQKELLVDMQGNWGNILTGDRAAAPRYIEARPSKFALEVVFNPKTTNWLLTYDGRNKEPEVLPVKFPLLLAQGVEGIAVGLASKILPHNFIELLDASIAYLQNKDFVLFPDFVTGGMADISKYNDGLRGGRVRVRARISKEDKKTLIISEIPFSTTTSAIIDSIVLANDKGKIKIKKIEDNTAQNVEIKIHLGPGVSPDQTIDALYAFTQCEVSLSPNSCVIDNDKPKFLGVKKLLKISADNTVELLKMELEIRRNELMESWHYTNLEKIFIRERIYRDIEEAESWEDALLLIDKGLTPFKPIFKREITSDDIARLTEIRIKRISKYNEFKADEQINELENQIKEVEHHLAHLIEYSIDYFKNIRKKYGAGRERKTELRSFENIDAAAVAVSNVKLYVNREEGFIGTGLKKDEFLFECSDIDDIIVFRENGTFTVIKLADKVFVGKDIIHVGVFSKNDDRTIYNLIYRDGKAGNSYAKRFAITSITRDKIYHITQGKPESKILYFTANPNGEAEIIKIKLRPRAKIRRLNFDFEFSELAIKGRASRGNLVTKNLISTIILKEDGVSTLGARDIWYDDTVKRLNSDGRGIKLGAFGPEDKIVTILSTGEYLMTNYDLSNHFDEDMVALYKFDPEEIWTVVYFDGTSASYYLKRFNIEPSDKKVSMISDHVKSRMVHFSNNLNAAIKILFDTTENPKMKEEELIDASEFIDVKGFKARGKRITDKAIKKIELIEPEYTDEDLEEDLDEEDIEVEIIEDDESESSEVKLISTPSIIEASDPIISNNNEVDETSSVIIKPKIDHPIKKKKELNQLTENQLNEPKIERINNLPDVLPILNNEEIVIPKAIENKADKNARKPKSNINTNKKVRLDSDEPLQMELDF